MTATGPAVKYQVNGQQMPLSPLTQKKVKEAADEYTPSNLPDHDKMLQKTPVSAAKHG